MIEQPAVEHQAAALIHSGSVIIVHRIKGRDSICQADNLTGDQRLAYYILSLSPVVYQWVLHLEVSDVV